MADPVGTLPQPEAPFPDKSRFWWAFLGAVVPKLVSFYEIRFVHSADFAEVYLV